MTTCEVVAAEYCQPHSAQQGQLHTKEPKTTPQEGFEGVCGRPLAIGAIPRIGHRPRRGVEGTPPLNAEEPHWPMPDSRAQSEPLHQTRKTKAYNVAARMEAGPAGKAPATQQQALQGQLAAHHQMRLKCQHHNSHSAICLIRQAARARALNQMALGCLAVGPGRDRPSAHTIIVRELEIRLIRGR